PGVLVSKKIAGAADTRLDLVENQKQPVLIAELPQRTQKPVRHDTHTSLAHERLDHDSGGVRTDRFLRGIEIGESDLIESLDGGPETFKIFLVAGRGDGGKRATVKCALKCDDAEALRLARSRLILARHLDRALDRLGA